MQSRTSPAESPFEERTTPSPSLRFPDCTGKLKRSRVMLLAFATMTTDQRRDVADHDADRGRQQDDDDQRRVEAGKEDFEADLLRVLQGDDQDQRNKETHEPGAPVDRLLPLLHPPILVPPDEADLRHGHCAKA